MSDNQILNFFSGGECSQDGLHKQTVDVLGSSTGIPYITVVSHSPCKFSGSVPDLSYSFTTQQQQHLLIGVSHNQLVQHPIDCV